MLFQLEALEEALRSLGAVLQQRRTPYSLLVVGGSGLLLLRLIDRPTGDLDVIGLAENGHYNKVEELPEPLASAAEQVGRALELANDWLNTGPASLMDFGLPSRFDQICFKLYAAVDHGPDDKHFVDLKDLRPTRDELKVAARWTITHDPSDGFRQELLGCLSNLDVGLDNADL